MTHSVQSKIAEIKAKTEKAPEKAPEKPAPKTQSKDKVVEYLEGRISELEAENASLKQILMLYGEHSLALAALTNEVFNQEQPNPADTNQEEQDDSSN